MMRYHGPLEEDFEPECQRPMNGAKSGDTRSQTGSRQASLHRYICYGSQCSSKIRQYLPAKTQISGGSALDATDAETTDTAGDRAPVSARIKKKARPETQTHLTLRLNPITIELQPLRYLTLKVAGPIPSSIAFFSI